MKTIKCGTITSEMLFDAQKPQYRPASRCGAHKNKKKYDRKRAKAELRNMW